MTIYDEINSLNLKDYGSINFTKEMTKCDSEYLMLSELATGNRHPINNNH